ncbi:MAG: hypothetical protein ACLPWS_09210 [Rhodomicrobium sp.]
MAGQGKATAGHTSTGSHDPEAALAGGAAGAIGEGLLDAGTSPDGQEPSLAVFGHGHTEAEAELYARYDKLTSPQPPSFRPIAELSARLSEFDQPSKDSGPLPDRKEEEELAHPQAPAQNEPYPSGPDWFEQRFAELRRLLSRKEEGREIAGINAKLAEMNAQLEKLAAAMPGRDTMAAVETRLDALSQSLGETREQTAAGADRISQAAREILAGAARIKDAPARFEVTARHTLEGLGRTVVATASRAAVLAAENVVSLQRTGETGGVERLESELRELNRQSRETGERTAAALDRVHGTLRDFLERSPRTGDAAAPLPHKKRPGVHKPISSDSPEYTRGDTGFGSKHAPEARLDTLLRTPRPSDPALFEALQEAENRLFEKRRANPPRYAGPAEPAPAAAFTRTDFFLDGERGLPPAGVAVVAFILLLVSGALFYLHTTARIADQPVSALPRAGAPAAALASRPAAKGAPARAWAVLGKRAVADAGGGSTLLAAESQAGGASEDWSALETAAQQGDREAQFRIGARFLSDTTLAGGAAAAARWLERAAGKGHIEAQFMLASLYERGAGVAKDEAQAMALYRKAAAAGHVRAMHNLGVLFSAHATPQDYREAALWFSRAAEAGFADSQYNLALLYERGLGLEQDLTRAYYWYEAAAKAGDKEAIRQASRLKRTLPAADATSVGEKAGTWRPALENSTKSADWVSVRG